MKACSCYIISTRSYIYIYIYIYMIDICITWPSSWCCCCSIMVASYCTYFACRDLNSVAMYWISYSKFCLSYLFIHQVYPIWVALSLAGLSFLTNINYLNIWFLYLILKLAELLIKKDFYALLEIINITVIILWLHDDWCLIHQKVKER